MIFLWWKHQKPIIYVFSKELKELGIKSINTISSYIIKILTEIISRLKPTEFSQLAFIQLRNLSFHLPIHFLSSPSTFFFLYVTHDEENLFLNSLLQHTCPLLTFTFITHLLLLQLTSNSFAFNIPLPFLCWNTQCKLINRSIDSKLR